MNDGKKRRSSAKLSAHKRFAKSCSRYIIYDYEIPEGADIDIDVDYTPAE